MKLNSVSRIIYALSLTVFFLLSGCALFDWSEQEADLGPEPTFYDLTLIPKGDPSAAYALLYKNSPPTNALSASDEALLQKECNATATTIVTTQALGPWLISAAAGAFGKWVVNKIDKALADAVKAYTTEYQSSITDRPFYDPSNLTSTTPAWSCFRFVRYEEKQSTQPQVDLIGQFAYGPHGE